MSEFDDWQRVDVRTVLLVAVPAVAATAFFVLLAVAGGASATELGIEVLWPLIGVGIAVARYVSGRFRLADGAVHWTSGVLTRQATQVPFDRVQDVEVTRPLIARILGCSAVRVSTAGGAGGIELSYLDRDVADRLGAEVRRQIAVARGGSGVADDTGAPPAATSPPGVVLHRVSNAELARWALRRLWPLPVVVVVAVVVTAVAGAGAVSLSLLPATPLVLLGFVRTVVDRVGLTARLDERTVATTVGLSTLRRTSTPRDRVHIVSSNRIWAQLLSGTESVRYASADVSGDDGDGTLREELALDVPAGTWAGLATAVTGCAVPPDDRMRRKPAAVVAASTRRGIVRGAFAGVAVGVAAAVVVGGVGRGVVVGALSFVATVVAGAVVGAVVGRWRHRVERWWVGDDALVVTHGVIRRTSALLRISKLQAIEVTSGPMQRRLGLVTMIVDVAPPSQPGALVIRDVTVAEGVELERLLTAAGTVPLPDGV